MARFVRSRRVETRAPIVTVDAGLPLGKHRFQLIVIDDAGNRSRPAEIEVIIERVRSKPSPMATRKTARKVKRKKKTRKKTKRL